VDYNLPYIQWRMLIGLWLMVILLVLAVAELTFLVHYFTRFSEEVFIGITGFFFFYEACLSIVHVSVLLKSFEPPHVHCSLVSVMALILTSFWLLPCRGFVDAVGSQLSGGGGIRISELFG